jgi:hypothetical protein
METKVTKKIKKRKMDVLIKSGAIVRKRSAILYTQAIPLPRRGGLIFREN